MAIVAIEDLEIISIVLESETSFPTARPEKTIIVAPTRPYPMLLLPSCRSAKSRARLMSNGCMYVKLADGKVRERPRFRGSLITTYHMSTRRGAAGASSGHFRVEATVVSRACL